MTSPISRTITSFVATGDSFTEGLEDDLGPDGRHQGWADRVASGLAQLNGGVRYANLAVRGKVLRQVVDEQVPRALAMRPDLVSFHAGINDMLRPRVDRAAILAQYEGAVRRIREAGAQVLLFTVVGRTGGSGRTADAIAARFDQFAEHVHRVGAEYGCLVVDLGRYVALQDRRLIHPDRLHPAPQGHQRVAAAVLETLGVDDDTILRGTTGWWHQPLPAAPATSRRAEVQADLYWAARYLAPWVGRRLRGASSGDGVKPKYPNYVDIPCQADA